MFDLANALKTNNATLIKAFNGECNYPINVLNKNLTVSDYISSGSSYLSIKDIDDNKNLTPLEKDIKINYIILFGTQKGIDNYKKSGILTKENDKGMGISHIVKRQDYIDYLNEIGEFDRADLFKKKDINKVEFFIDVYTTKKYVKKEFNRKLWVVQLKDKKTPIPFLVKLINIITTPLKYIPTRSVLRMEDYKNVTYTVGGVTNGYSIEFQIPKKFGFNN